MEQGSCDIIRPVTTDPHGSEKDGNTLAYQGKRKEKLLRNLPRIAVLGVLLLAAFLAVFFLIRHELERISDREAPDRAGALCTVCLDPGHGGNDRGTSWEERLEKEDNLRMALALKEALEEENIYVLLTRSDDTEVSLEDRVAFANENGADLYLSLHRNSAEDACGVELWLAEAASAQSQELAELLRSALVSVGVQNDRGVRYGTQSGVGSYYVLQYTAMPAVLLELGFIQDEEDNRLFDDYMEDYARAMAQAVAAYWKDRTDG